MLKKRKLVYICIGYKQVSRNFMSDTIPNFDKQELKLSNENWKVEIFFERGNSESEEFVSYDKTIELSELGVWTSNLLVRTTNKNQIIKSCLISGLDGGIYLHTSNDKEKSYSVKLTASPKQPQSVTLL